MTSEQVKTIERVYRTPGSDGKQLVPAFTLLLDELLAFDSQRSFVTFDEDSETIVCVRSNNDVYTQVKYPLSIAATGFDDVVCMEAFCNMLNFEAAINALCPSMDPDVKDKIITWGTKVCGNVRNLAPMEDRPYYKKEPIPGGAFFEPIPRPDLGPGDTVYDQGGFDNV